MNSSVASAAKATSSGTFVTTVSPQNNDNLSMCSVTLLATRVHGQQRFSQRSFHRGEVIIEVERGQESQRATL